MINKHLLHFLMPNKKVLKKHKSIILWNLKIAIFVTAGILTFPL